MFSFGFLGECFVEAIKGIPIALLITAISLVVALFLGYAFAFIRLHRYPVLNQLVMVFISFIRGTPVIVQLFVVLYAVPIVILNKFDVNLYNINPIYFAVFVFSANAVTGMTEIIRSALGSVDKGQIEAARSVGLTGMQAYTRIVIPQAVVTALPALANLTTGIFKMTSLGTQVRILEITGKAKLYASTSYRYLEAFTAIMVTYLLVNFVIERIFRFAEIRAKNYKKLAVN